jgi:hypothetical protein
MHNDITPIENIPSGALHNLKGVFFDLDDTFTTRGKIPACSFTALWDLRNAGLTVKVLACSSLLLVASRW